MSDSQGNCWDKKSKSVFKLFLLWFLPGMLVLTAGIYLFYRQQTIIERRLLLTQQESQVQVLRRRMLQDLEGSSRLTETLAKLPALRSWSPHSPQTETDQLAALFLTMLDNLKNYDQIRFIGLDGQEVARVEHVLGQPRITPQAELQNKSQRYYYQIGRELGPQEQYISPLDLNMEHGQIEFPWKPTIRFVRGVFDRTGQRIGVLVVNFLATFILNDLKNASVEPGIAMLLNQQGYWLHGAPRDRLFGFMFPNGKNHRMAVEYPQVWSIINKQSSGQEFSPRGLFTFNKVSPAGTMPVKPSWIIVSFVPAKAVDQRVGMYLHHMLLLWLAVMCAAAIGAWTLARNQARRSQAEARTVRSACNQGVLNRLLELSLEGGNLDYQLHSALTIILDTPWIGTLPKGAIFLVAENDPLTLNLVTAKDIDQKLLTLCESVPFGHCHCGRAAQSGEIQHCSQVDDRHQTTYEGMAQHGHYCVPILSGARCLGVMVLYQLPGQDPREGVIEFLKPVARTLAGIIEASRASQKLADSEARYKAVLNNAVEGIITIDTAGIIQSFNNAAEKIFGYSAKEAIGQPVAIIQPAVIAAQHQKYVERYLDTGQAHIIGFGREVIGKKKDGTLVPLYLSVGEVRQGGRITFTGILRDITKLKQYEDQLTKAKIAAEATSRELAEKQARLDEDLKAAAGIQRALLPGQLPDRPEIEMIWHFEPSQHIGGDIFEAFMLDNDHLLIYMVDVSGHGVPSALVTVSVHDMLELHSGLIVNQKGIITPPSDVLAMLDQRYPLERFDKHFTIAYMVLNLTNGELVYSSAGHPPPVLLRTRADLELLEAGGSLIGLNMDIPFEEDRLVLQPGDRLLLYTDGVIEFQNPKGELFGLERFVEILASNRNRPLPEIFHLLERELKSFGQGAPLADDVSILALEYRGPSRP